MPTNWARSMMVVSYLCCRALKRAFNFSFLSSVRVIDMATESRTKPKNLICYDGISDDFSILITKPNLVNKVCAAQILSMHSLASFPCKYESSMYPTSK